MEGVSLAAAGRSDQKGSNLTPQEQDHALSPHLTRPASENLHDIAPRSPLLSSRKYHRRIDAHHCAMAKVADKTHMTTAAEQSRVIRGVHEYRQRRL